MKRLLSLLLVPLVALALTACGTASEVAKTPQQRVFAAKSDYAAILAVAVAYESQRRCAPGEPIYTRCSNTAVVMRLRQADDTAKVALDAAEATVRNPATSGNDVELALTSATNAVGVLRTILISVGAMK